MSSVSKSFSFFRLLLGGLSLLHDLPCYYLLLIIIVLFRLCSCSLILQMLLFMSSWYMSSQLPALCKSPLAVSASEQFIVSLTWITPSLPNLMHFCLSSLAMGIEVCSPLRRTTPATSNWSFLIVYSMVTSIFISSFSLLNGFDINLNLYLKVKLQDLYTLKSKPILLNQ